MILIPERQIKLIIDLVLNKIDEQYLLSVFGDQKLGVYDFFENAKTIFLKKQDNPRLIESHLFFNRDRAALPTVHLSLPSEVMSGDNGINFESEVEFSESDPTLFREISSKSYGGKYNIIFTSNNTFEVLIMYNVFKSFFQGNISLLELNGLRNVKISGNDIILNEGIVPEGVYSRVFSLECVYTFRAPSFGLKESVGGVTLNNQEV